MPTIGSRVAVAIAVLALSAGMLHAEPVLHQPTGIAFPDQLADFARGRVTDLETQYPGQGFTYAYVLHPEVQATVYVYAAGRCPVPAEIGNAVLSRMREQTVGEIRAFAQSGNEEVQDVASETVQVDAGQAKVPVFFDSFIVRGKDESRSTAAWLWTSRGHFLKIRLTARAPVEADWAAMQRFVQEVVRLAVPDPAAAAARGKRVTARVRINIDAALNPQEERAAWLLYGISLLEWVEQCVALESRPAGSPLGTNLEAERYARGKQLRLWREIGRKNYAAVAYLEDLLKVEDAGFFTEYLWQYLRRQEWGPPPPGLRMEEFGQWRARNLSRHTPQTRAWLSLPR
jgi:hypothetical protein